MIGAGLLMTPLAFLAPIVYFRRTRWRTFFLTYMVPLTPLLACFDGVASCMRAYKPEEMLSIARSVEGYDDYEWNAGKESFLGLFNLTYLVAQPRAQIDRDTQATAPLLNEIRC
jgi:hypothetical protein